MNLKKITAIIDNSTLDDVEQRLTSIGVNGFSVSQVSGRGEYRNFFRADVKTQHMKIEVFTREADVDKIVSAIIDVAHRGTQEDGIIAVLPVEKLYRIRTREEVSAGSL